MFAAMAAIAAVFTSCDPNEGKEPTPGPDTPDTPAYTENLTFTIEVKEVEADKAKFGVEHNGTKSDSWHYFATTETNIDKAIEDEVTVLLESGKANLQSSTKKSVTVRNLEPETDYTFVVFGLTADGKVYGEVATEEFTTPADQSEVPTPPAGEYTVNPAWTVTYIGDYEQEGEVYENVVYVESTDSNPFFVTAWPVSYVEEYGMATIVDAEIQGWNELLAQYPDATWADIVVAETSLHQVQFDAQYGNEWYAMAIGCDTNGNSTYLYALSEVIDLNNLGGDDTELTPAYAAWLGDWTFTGANGVTQNVTFSKGEANETFKMSGYEGPDAEGLDVVVEWLEEDACWVIYNQKLGTFDFGSYGPGDIWFLGEDETENVYLSELPICIGGTFEDGSLGAIGYEEQYEAEDGTPMTYKVVVMEYLAYLTDYGQLSYITGTYETGYPTFPITITPATKANQCSVKEFKGGKKTLNPFAPKTYTLSSTSFRTL